MARYIYALFAIEQGDFDGATHIIKKAIGRDEFVADLWFLRFYSLFKQGRVKHFDIFKTLHRYGNRGVTESVTDKT